MEVLVGVVDLEVRRGDVLLDDGRVFEGGAGHFEDVEDERVSRNGYRSWWGIVVGGVYLSETEGEWMKFT